MSVRSWDGLTPAYKRRLERAGITRKAYESGASVTAARGHAKTPERPTRVARNPDRYPEYLATRQELQRQVIARKERLFKDRMRRKFKHGRWIWEKGYNAKESAEAVTKRNPSIKAMREFLAMDDFEALVVIEPDTEYEFLFYH